MYGVGRVSDEDFKAACELAVEEFRKLAPRKTGNLAYHAITMEFTNAKECHIYVDEAIAPYMPFTNEPWISPKWNGKQNPNEAWWQTACEYIMYVVKDLLGGELKEK